MIKKNWCGMKIVWLWLLIIQYENLLKINEIILLDVEVFDKKSLSIKLVMGSLAVDAHRPCLE
jgi:hypothetical protein